jgi:hypothetical protein
VVHRQNNLARQSKCPITNLLAVEDKLWIMRPGKQRVDVERPSSTATHEQREEEQDDRRWLGHHAFDHCCHYFHPVQLYCVSDLVPRVTLSRVKQAPKVLLRGRSNVTVWCNPLTSSGRRSLTQSTTVGFRVQCSKACPFSTVFHHVLRTGRGFCAVIRRGVTQLAS